MGAFTISHRIVCFVEGTSASRLGGGGAALEGTGTPTQRFVYFNVKGNSDITVQFVSGSSGSARDLFISDGTTVLSKTKMT